MIPTEKGDKAMKYIYIASLYRFGYELTVAETSEQKAKAAVMAKYAEVFENINGFRPDEEESDRGYADGSTWLEDAESDVCISKMAIGEVWYR